MNEFTNAPTIGQPHGGLNTPGDFVSKLRTKGPHMYIYKDIARMQRWAETKDVPIRRRLLARAWSLGEAPPSLVVQRMDECGLSFLSIAAGRK